MNIKESVERIIHNLPDNASMDDVNYHLYIFEKLEQANVSESNFGLHSNETAVERIRKCLSR